MGRRGPAPKPTAVRRVEGNRSHRALPVNEPQYAVGIPDRPAAMSAGARRIWDQLVIEMAPTGVLRTVDALALAQLCEDQSTLNELRAGLRKMTAEIARQAKSGNKKLPGGALLALSRSIEGRRTLATIRELSSQIIVQRREFGLTPASNGRVQAHGVSVFAIDPLEAKLCG